MVNNEKQWTTDVDYYKYRTNGERKRKKKFGEHYDNLFIT